MNINLNVNLLSHEQKAVQMVVDELAKAMKKFKPFNSAHEGYAVILEELDELWDEVKVNDSQRLNEVMRDEAIQVAAMGIRFIIDICMKDEI